MEKPSSTRRPGGTGQVKRRTGSLLHPGDCQLPQIVPPATDSFSRFRTEISNYGAPGGRDGSAQGATGGGGSVTLESPSDDATPISQTLQDRLDFSIIFGAIQANSKYNKNQGNEDEGPDIPDPSGKQQRKEERQKSSVPGQSITIFAFRVALLEKTASGLGKIAFLWATVVILGGFASTVALTDFLVVTLIILAQTTRIFGRSHELEWQHLLSTSGGEVGLSRVVGNAFRSLSATLSRTEDSPHVSTTGPECKRTAISATSAPATLFKLFRKHKKVQQACVIAGPETAEARKMREERKLVCEEAGQTLARLVIQNEKNFVRLLELKDKRNEKRLVRVMVEALSNSEKIASSAALMLRSALKYADDSTKRAIATQTSTLIIENIFLIRPDASTKLEMYEAFLGLAARTVEKFDVNSYHEILETVNKAEFVQQLTRNLRHTPTTKRFPSIRRFTLELIIALSQRTIHSLMLLKSTTGI